MASVVKSHPVPSVLGFMGVSSILIKHLKQSKWYSHQYSDLMLMRAILDSPRGPTSVSEITKLKHRYSLVNYKLSAINVLSKCMPRISIIAFAFFSIGLEERLHRRKA
jgi:hypothetical protein